MRIVLIFLMVIMAFGCSSDKNIDSVKKEFTPVNNNVYSVTTPTGVDCVVFSTSYRGGISCNWEKYNKEQGK